MKTRILFCFILLAVTRASADGVDVFRQGLRAFQTNGPEALLRTWYNPHDQDKIETLRGRLAAAVKDYGEVFEVEVFAPKQVGRYIQRLYGVIYFAEHPLWIRAEYYSINGRSGFLSMEFSGNADDILPLEIGVTGK